MEASLTFLEAYFYVEYIFSWLYFGWLGSVIAAPRLGNGGCTTVLG